MKKPRYTRGFVDRHGKPRFYLRRPGQKQIPLPGLPWSPEFMEAYEAGMKSDWARADIGSQRTVAGTVNAAIVSYYNTSADFLPVVVYGPHPKGNFRTLVRLASLPLPLPVKGLTARRSLLGIDNLISAIILVLDNQHALGQTFLVVDPAPLTLIEILAVLRKAQGRAPWQVYVPPFLIRRVFLLLGYPDLWERIGENLVVDTSNLESLGWRAPLETYEGLTAMMRAEDGKASENDRPHSYL